MKNNPNIQLAINRLAASTKAYLVNELRIIVATERAVARLQSEELIGPSIIFKGGFVLVKTTDTHRFTKDLDASVLGVKNEKIPASVERALAIDLNDGVWFGEPSCEDIVIGGHYGGYRFNVPYQLSLKGRQTLKPEKLSKSLSILGSAIA